MFRDNPSPQRRKESYGQCYKKSAFRLGQSDLAATSWREGHQSVSQDAAECFGALFSTNAYIDVTYFFAGASKLLTLGNGKLWI